MKTVQGYPFEPKYKRDNGLVVLDLNNPPLPDGFELRETSVVRLPAGEIAGNHKHPRQEAYFCLDEGVELHWLDKTGQVHVDTMAGTDKPQLFVVPPFTPHAVVNISRNNVTLFGYADGPFENVEQVQVTTLAQNDDEGLSEQEVTQVVHLLSKLKPGYLPFDIFHAITRLAVTPIIEVVPLRKSEDGKVEILLLKREADDPVWPGQLHVPGTVVQASDTPGSFTDPLQRILSKELAGTKTSEPTFVKNILHHSGRGMEASQVFWVEVRGEPTAGDFYGTGNLPELVVKSQLDFIPDAIAHFNSID